MTLACHCRQLWKSFRQVHRPPHAIAVLGTWAVSEPSGEALPDLALVSVRELPAEILPHHLHPGLKESQGGAETLGGGIVHEEILSWSCLQAWDGAQRASPVAVKLPQLPRFPVPVDAEPANDLGASALDTASALNDCEVPVLVDEVLALHPELPALVAGILVKESGVPALVHGELVNESGSRGMESGDLRILPGSALTRAGSPG